MSAADIAQIASAAFTALAAGAAWLTVRHAESQNETSRAALDAQTQPLLADLPYGVFRAPVRRTTMAGTRMGMDEWEDEAEIRVGTYSTRRGDGPSFGASLGVRNVGNGTARIQRAVLNVGAEQVAAHIANPVVPPGEFTRVGFMIDYDAPNVRPAETIGAELSDFEVRVLYADASGRPRGELRLQIANGERPRVTEREWPEPFSTAAAA